MAGPVVIPGTQIDSGGGDANFKSPEIKNIINIQNPLANIPGVAADIQMLLAITSDPDLQAAWIAYKDGKYDDMQAAILRSAFYRNNNKIARERAIAEKNQPGVWEQDRNAFILSAKKRLIDRGVPWNDSVKGQLDTAYRMGLTDDQADALVASVLGSAKIGGEISGDVYQLKAYASSYGVDFLYDDNYWQQQSRRLFSGDTTIEDIQSELRAMAEQTYPAFAPGFAAGKSLDLQTGYIRQTVARTLGLDPNGLLSNNPLVSKWYQWKDPKTGEFVAPPQWFVEQKTKEENLDLWANGPEGRGTIDRLSSRLLKDMGLM